jgi:hypothetical protein
MFDFYHEEDKMYIKREDFFHTNDTLYLPKELLPIKIQHFLKQLLRGNISQSVLTQLNTNCTIFKLIGENATKIIFEKLTLRNPIVTYDQNTNVFTITPPDEFVSGKKYEIEYKINILTLYTLFSLANSDECVFTEAGTGTNDNNNSNFLLALFFRVFNVLQWRSQGEGHWTIAQ